MSLSRAEFTRVPIASLYVACCRAAPVVAAARAPVPVKTYGAEAADCKGRPRPPPPMATAPAGRDEAIESNGVALPGREFSVASRPDHRRHRHAETLIPKISKFLSPKING